jgi:hypothetical protein
MAPSRPNHVADKDTPTGSHHSRRIFLNCVSADLKYWLVEEVGLKGE